MKAQCFSTFFVVGQLTHEMTVPSKMVGLLVQVKWSQNSNPTLNPGSGSRTKIAYLGTLFYQSDHSRSCTTDWNSESLNLTSKARFPAPSCLEAQRSWRSEIPRLWSKSLLIGHHASHLFTWLARVLLLFSATSNFSLTVVLFRSLVLRHPSFSWEHEQHQNRFSSENAVSTSPVQLDSAGPCLVNAMP